MIFLTLKGVIVRKKKLFHGVTILIGLFLIACSAAKTAKTDQQEKPTRTSRTKALDKSTQKVVHGIPILENQSASVLETTGTALPIRESVLSSPVAGRIDRIFVTLGERVKKGDALLRFEPENFRFGVDRAQAAVDGAKVMFRQAALELKRIQRLKEAKVATGANLDKVQASHDGAHAGLAGAEAALKQAQKAYDDSVLRAPYAGTVDGILKEIGEFAPAMPPTMLVKLVDCAALSVQAFLPEDDSLKVHQGQRADVFIESANAKTVGQITFVSNRLQPGTRTFEIRIDIENPDEKIKAGSFARIRIQPDTEHNQVWLPLAALREVKDDGATVLVSREGVLEKAFVQLGRRENGQAEIVGGLHSKQIVVTSDDPDLQPGQHVTVKMD